jgi:predicted HAD superfamily Cof-like phosphohydrolase
MSGNKDNRSNFEKIHEFQDAFEMRYYKECKTTNLIDNPELIKLRMALIDEEVKELHQAVDEHDMGEVRDAIADILYVVYGMAQSLAIDADTDFDIVHKSNMSKLCVSEDAAKLTVADYQRKYKEGNSPYDSPYYYYKEEMDKWIVKNKSTGKVLKSINYTPVNFTNE